MDLRNQIEALRQYYNRLSRWGKWFFPKELAQLLSSNNATGVDIVNAAFNSTWFYHRWFFSGLTQFFNNPLIKNSRTLFTLKSDRQWLHQHVDDNALQFVLKLNQNEPLTPSLYRQHMLLLKNKSPHVWSVLGFLGSIPSAPFTNRRALGDYLETLSRETNLTNIGSLAEFMAKLPPQLHLFDSRSVAYDLLNHEQPATLRECLDLLSRGGALAAQTVTHLASLDDLHPVVNLLRIPHNAEQEGHESRAQRLQRIVMEQQPTNNNSANYLGAGNNTRRNNDGNMVNNLLSLLVEENIPLTNEMRESIMNHSHFDDLYSGALYFQTNDILTGDNFNAILHAKNIQLTVNGILPPVRYETPAQQREVEELKKSGRTTLTNIVNSNESSMAALTSAETESFNRVKDHYRTTSYSFNNVLTDLAARYRQNPARLIRRNGCTVVLPLEWHEFRNLSLQGEDYQKALKMYYKHKVHTTWRYLKPGANPWSYQPTSHAPYQNGDQRAFENLVALLWVAVCDKSQPPARGEGSIDDRIDLFITEIAGMARAHNHDNPQAVLTDANCDPILMKNPNKKSGPPMITRKGKFDDLQPDHPSCGPGLNTRLFQSIWAHPLFQDRLPPIEAEFISALQDHFRDKFNRLTAEQLTTIRDTIADFAFATNEDKEPLRTLNMTAVDANNFRRYLEGKYTMYRASNDMKATVNDFMNQPYQVITFANAATVLDLLKTAIDAKQRPLVSLGNTGMFATSSHNPPPTATASPSPALA